MDLSQAGPELQAKAADTFPRARATTTRAIEKGLKIALGTDAPAIPHGRNADEFELMVQHGMKPVEALKAATVNAADLLGLSDEIGTIAPGKSADIVAVAGDPVADVGVLKTLDFVMARGRVID